MVNDVCSPKRAILERLRAAAFAGDGGDAPDLKSVSGDELGDELGVSRVAVWKQLESLREAGYAIESSHGGYRLLEDGDFLYPWEFPGREGRVVRFESTDSTMDRALEYALRDPGAGAIVVAESQTAGRGRRGRPWRSPPGGLFFTMVLAPSLPPESAGRLVMAGGIALCRALRGLCGEPFALGWPNDLFLQGKKAAGILPEFLAEGETLRFLDLGIGVNVANGRPMPGTCSLAGLGARGQVPRRDVLSRFLDIFEAMDPAREGLTAEWNSLSSDHGRVVRSRVDGSILGRAVGVDEDGAVIVETAIGKNRSYRPFEAVIAGKERRA